MKWTVVLRLGVSIRVIAFVSSLGYHRYGIYMKSEHNQKG